MMHWGEYGWGMGFGWIYMLLFWAAVVAVIAYLVRSVTNRSEHCTPVATPLDILKQRYARGQITREEYERMKDDLKRV